MEIHDDGNGIRVAWVDPVFISVFYGKPTVAALDFLSSMQSQAIGGEGVFANITILSPSSGLEMGADARKRAQEIQNATVERRVANVSLILGDGFFAAVARNIIAGVQMFAPRRHPWLVTGDLEEALTFLSTALTTHGRPMDRPRVEAGLRSLIAALK